MNALGSSWLRPLNSGKGGAGAFKACINCRKSWIDIVDGVCCRLSWPCAGAVLAAEGMCREVLVAVSVQGAVEAESVMLISTQPSILSLKLGATGFCWPLPEVVSGLLRVGIVLSTGFFGERGVILFWVLKLNFYLCFR